ncbi:hypothetical protein TTHERM_001365633 (macronuclear) [Tetrahymena thermophila SB210]|uniref:Uncharacterized protein n=1 Tax=Tetrahymena thermophila (strain SB210) TaxID=312017 RepID=W7XKR3_TETTS|nr:hypothetical protein TTHERM_001365633 [Tetrahymena thermophila SB210]EWS75134.1 hypothetical protein TTHERM_001365633 [Tetrahymena thermophila SB210]|eukprot:XP_012652329.1 hypothetical protein TTHERM_001365633 [Tetrahymena thermophila SB210]
MIMPKKLALSSQNNLAYKIFSQELKNDFKNFIQNLFQLLKQNSFIINNISIFVDQ